jgi:PAS domain-containing protein
MIKILISEEQKEKLKGNYNFFVDMDGVLTDFNRAYKELTGKEITKFRTDKDFWKEIDAGGEEYWSEMKWTSDGKKLWNYLKKYKPKVLSSPSQKKQSRTGKQKWINRELPRIELLLRDANKKKEFANEFSILIDDREPNIKDWIESGGIGILHTSTENTIKELKKLNL